ncbi:MAG: TlpA family protein disulfide reductase, partial [Armatimonadetes bacterium]|nr:TlpA family protein disulfide reductase [Anaerolineae bacterium]
WCIPCVAEMPALQTLADTHPATLTVLGINQRESADAVRIFAATHSIRFPLLLNPDDATLLAYQVVNLPQTLVIDPQGVLVDRIFGPIDTDPDFIARLTGLMQ